MGREQDDEPPQYVIDAEKSITRGCCTRFEMQVSQGVRKRQGAGRSQHFLEALQKFKRDAYEPPEGEGMVHPALMASAQIELSGASSSKESHEKSQSAAHPPAKKSKADAKKAPKASHQGASTR